MTDLSSNGWRELTRPIRSECPKLFYNFTFEQDSFRIHLTDLVAIWVCSLDRDGIISASKEQRLSIDPSESNQQFRVLLEKLKQSLQAGNNHLSRPKDEGSQIVYLNTKVDLPKPLKPLSWTFELNPEDAAELAEQLLRPCLHEASIAKQKIESLLRIIKDKDHVLSRLLEKIDNSSFDLSLIFPGITGLKPRKGRVTAKDAQRHVPGMSEFDHHRWSSSFDDDNPYTGFSVSGMQNLVSGCEKCPKHTTKQHSKWFEGLPVFGSKLETASPDVKRPLKRKKPDNDNGSTDTDNDFERQPTPPHLKKGNDVSAQTQSFSSRGSRSSKKVKLGKLGVSGNRGRSTASFDSFSSSPDGDASARREAQPPLDISQSVVKAKPQDSGSETETASENDADTLSKQRSTQSQFQKEPPPTSKSDRRTAGHRKLGRLQSHSSHEKSSSTSASTSPARRGGRQASLPKQNESSTLRKISRPQHSTPSPEGKKLDHLHSPTKPSQDPASKRTSRSDSETDSDLDLDDDNADHLKKKLEPKPEPKSMPNPTTNSRTSKTPSEPNTPSRRLGRVGKYRSESRSTSEANTPSKRVDKTSQATQSHKAASQTRQNENETYSGTDTESDSERNTGSPSPTPRAKTSLSRKRSRASSNSTPIPLEGQEKEAEQTKPETAEERANRRRMELKQRLNASSASGSGGGARIGIGGGGGRRKRKF